MSKTTKISRMPTEASADVQKWVDAFARRTVTTELAVRKADGQIHVASVTHTSEFSLDSSHFDQTDSHSSRNNRIYAGGGLMTKYPVIVKVDESGGYTCECPAIPGCFSEGETEEEALENIRTVIRDLIEIRQELGLPPASTVHYVEV